MIRKPYDIEHPHISGIVLLMTAILAAASCKSEIGVYSGDAGVYFAMSRKSTSANVDTMYNESTSLPFIITDRTDSVLNIRVKILGAVSEEDRTFRIETVAEGTDLLPEDCEKIDGDYILPAGSVYGNIPLHFHRSKSLEGQERKLRIRLVPNENFSLPITSWKNSSTEYVSVVEHTVYISDKYIQLPGYSTGYFGPFSEKKMKIILELSGLSLSDFNEPLPYTYSKTLGQQLDRYLKEMDAKGETVYEEDGTKMVAGEFIYS